MDLAKNFAKGTLAVGILDTDTSLDLSANNGARFPSPPFNATIWNSTDFPDPSDDPDVEVIRVTAITDDTFDTIERGQEGTAAVDHHIDGKTYQIVAGLTADLVNNHLLDVSKVGTEYFVAASDFTLSVDDVLQMFAVMVQLSGGLLLRLDSNVAGIGDLDGNNTGVAVRADDSTGQVHLAGQVVLDNIPNADPSIANALYYDSITGIVKRSAG
jgi:hypothetical protein